MKICKFLLDWFVIGAILSVLLANEVFYPDRATRRRRELESFLV
jgi:hypothetical protein